MPYKDKYLKIGQECEWLINHGLDVDWAANGYEKYRRLLHEKGLVSFQGQCDYPALESALNDYWGKDFLDSLFAVTEGSRFNGLAHQVERYKVQHYKPLHHILLMCFFAGRVNDFINSNLANMPNNPVYTHYHADGALPIHLIYSCGGVIAVISYICHFLGYKHIKAKYSNVLKHIICGSLKRLLIIWMTYCLLKILTRLKIFIYHVAFNHLSPLAFTLDHSQGLLY